MRRFVILGIGSVLFGWLGLALSPRPLMSQEEGRGGVRTGVVVGTAASSLAMTGLCAGGGYVVMDGILHTDASILGCAVWGALYGFIPALATGYGLSYPDRATGKGRLRTLALGTAGGALLGLAITAGGGRTSESLVYAALWGAGVGLVTAGAGPSVQAYLSPSPASPEARNASPLAIGLALRFPLP